MSSSSAFRQLMCAAIIMKLRSDYSLAAIIAKTSVSTSQFCSISRVSSVVYQSASLLLQLCMMIITNTVEILCTCCAAGTEASWLGSTGYPHCAPWTQWQSCHQFVLFLLEGWASDDLSEKNQHRCRFPALCRT